MKTIKLGEVCEFDSGFAFSSRYFSRADGIGLIRIRDIKNGYSTETKYAGDFDEKYLVRAGDYLIGLDGEFRCYQWRGEAALLNQRVCRLRENKDALDPRYFFYGINKHLKEIEDRTVFTTVKHLSVKQIKNIEFTLPPLNEQRRVVELLDAAFEKIDRAIKLTDKNIDFSSSLFKSEFKKIFTTLTDFEQVPLKDLARTGAGGTPNKSHPEYYMNGTVPWLRSGEVDKKEIVTSELKISEIGLKNSSAKVFPRDSVLVAMYGATAGQVGILKFDSATNQAVCAVYPNEATDPEFMYYALLSQKDNLLSQAVGNAQPNVSQIKIKNLKIPKLDLRKQKDIAAKIAHLDKVINELKNKYAEKTKKLYILKQSLLTQAFSESDVK